MQIGGEAVFRAKEGAQMGDIEGLRKMKYSDMNEKKLKNVSKEFESLFINMMFKSMRDSVPKGDWLNGGMKQEIFEDMLYNEYARNTANSGGIGLGDMVYRYLKTSTGSGLKS